MAVEIQSRGVLHLDEHDSAGRLVNTPLRVDHRLMARAHDGSIWYGFVLLECGQPAVQPGKSASIGIAFLNDEEAREAFPVGKPIRFGDGVSTRGTLTLECYL